MRTIDLVPGTVYKATDGHSYLCKGVERVWCFRVYDASTNDSRLVLNAWKCDDGLVSLEFAPYGETDVPDFAEDGVSFEEGFEC